MGLGGRRPSSCPTARIAAHAVPARPEASMAGFHDITAAIIGAGFIGPVHVEGLRRLGVA